MLIFRAIFTNSLSQTYDGNKACARTRIDGTPYQPYQIANAYESGICPVGYKKFYPLLGLNSHGAQDWTSYRGEPVYFNIQADTEWKVYQRNDDPSYGLYLEIISTKPVVNEHHVKAIFVHAYKNLVKEGDTIVLGQQIQEADSTGASSGHHVHFSIKLCDSEGNTFNKANGWKGAIDPAPYFDNIFVLDYLKKKEILRLSQQVLKLLLQLKLQLQNTTGRIGALFKQ